MICVYIYIYKIKVVSMTVSRINFSRRCSNLNFRILPFDLLLDQNRNDQAIEIDPNFI